LRSRDSEFLETVFESSHFRVELEMFVLQDFQVEIDQLEERLRSCVVVPAIVCQVDLQLEMTS
jgi:hypothetical protein